MKYLLLIALLFIGIVGNAQSFEMSNPFSTVKPKSTVRRMALSLTPAATPSTAVNTFKANVSIPGYYYSSGKQQSVVVGFGYCFEHYVNDSLIYSIGPYIWYNSPIPTGSTQLPIGYGAAAGYKGIFLVGGMTPDFVHWGLVTSLLFSFGNGGISIGGFNL
jgi:hypothetical protein